MFFSKRDCNRMDHVEIHQLERYLRATGWTSDDPDDGLRRRTWEKLGFSIEAPTWAGFADYGRRVADVVQTLARVEDRYPGAVLDDLMEERR